MSGYTPVTSQVRETFAHDDRAEYEDPITYPTFVKDQRRAFNRWLAAHDAEIRTAALEEAAEIVKNNLGRSWLAQETLGDIAAAIRSAKDGAQ